MQFSSTLYFMAIKPDHIDFSHKTYDSEDPIYVWKNNTVYKRTHIWRHAFKQWLIDNGVDCEDKAVYTPIAHVENDVLTGYHTQYPNISNRFLNMSSTRITTYYPNLYWVQIGNHPYPKEGRWNHTWLEDMFHRECHRIIYPDSDPKKFFILPKDILP
jgi:hypothetical protein